MVGINPTVAFHKLNVLPTARPVKQKVRRLDQLQIMKMEVDNFLAVGFIRKVKVA